MTDTQRLEHVFTVQQRIAQVARERPQEVFTSLNHYLDVEWLKAAYERGQTGQRSRRGWPKLGRLWQGLGKEPAEFAQPGQKRELRCAAGQTGASPQRRRQGDSTHRYA